MRLTFQKIERLTHEREIARLWSKDAQRIFRHPLLLFWLKTEKFPNPPVKVLFSVPKRKFKKAHDRNRIKRLMREAYRLKKPMMLNTLGSVTSQYHLAFQYVADDLPDFRKVNETLLILLNRFTDEARKNH